jgi:hypothetical protein
LQHVDPGAIVEHRELATQKPIVQREHSFQYGDAGAWYRLGLWL